MINGHGKDGDVDSDGDAVYSFIFVISVIVSLFLNVHHCKTIWGHHVIMMITMMVM